MNPSAENHPSHFTLLSFHTCSRNSTSHGHTLSSAPVSLTPMPPRTPLLELAARRNNYVCRSCLSALGATPSQPSPTSFTSGTPRYAGRLRPSIPRSDGAQVKSKSKARQPHPRPNLSTDFEADPPPAPAGFELPDFDDFFRDPTQPKPKAKPRTEESIKDPRKDSEERPDFTVNYFKKDPKTGETEKLDLGDNEGIQDANLENMEEDLLNARQSIFQKMALLGQSLGKFEKIGGVLERIVKQHGGPEAAEALEKMMKEYDLPPGLQDEEAEPELESVVSSAKSKAKSKEQDDADNVPDLPAVQPDPDKFKPNQLANRQLKTRVALLNTKLKACNRKLAKGKLTQDQITDTWKTFANVTHGQQTHFIIPEEVWDVLWKTFSTADPQDQNKPRRIWSLSKMMMANGHFLSEERQLAGIEAAFECGQQSVAVDEWKRQAAFMGDKDTPITIAYWDLGVRMWSTLGDIERAERASKTLLTRASAENPADSLVLLHLIRAYLDQPETAEKGFQLYRRMRELATRIEKPMQIEDYDTVIALFLECGHTDYAMYAFTDMMFAGTVDLHGKAKLPNQLRNYFFFGKWLKRLIGAGDLDGAYSVLVFMQKNGVVAAPIQVNGLIGAYIRTGVVAHRAKAERLAWAMIRSREVYVDLRSRSQQAEWPMRLLNAPLPKKLDNSSPPSPDEYTLVPRATVETFVILAENYRERKLFPALEALFTAYQNCQLPGDAMMMNELLMAAVEQHDGAKARDLYTRMVEHHHITPSPDTFAILFRSLAINQLHGPHLHAHELPVHRSQIRGVFHQLMKASYIFNSKGRPRDRLSPAQVRLILHSFRKANDWPGVVVVLEALRDEIDFPMTRGIALEMLGEVEGLARANPTYRTGRLAVNATLKLHAEIARMQKAGLLPMDAVQDRVKASGVLYTVVINYYMNKMTQAEEKVEQAIMNTRFDLGLR